MAGKQTVDKPRSTRITEADKDAYLARLSEGHSHRASAEPTGHSRISYWKMGERDPEFKERMKQALEDGVQVLEEAARLRAVEGAEGSAPSDILLMFLLKAKRPAVYRDRVSVDHSGSIETTGLEGIPDAALELWERIVSGDLPLDRMEMVNRLMTAEDKDLEAEVDKILKSAAGLPAPRRRTRKQPAHKRVAGVPDSEGSSRPQEASPRIRTSKGKK